MELDVLFSSGLRGADIGKGARRVGSRRRKPIAFVSVAAGLLLHSRQSLAQEALQNYLSAQTTNDAWSLQREGPYTLKSGDFRMLVSSTVNLDWNDNVNLSRNAPLQDFVVTPTVGLRMTYPITERNLLMLDVTFGYMEYIKHSQFSAWYVQSGSALSFDLYVKDVRINLHDRFSYVQDSSQQPAVANTGTYGSLQNTVGATGTWDLEDVVLTLGYDHLNYLSTSQQFSYTDRASELVVASAGFKFHPTLTAGLEGTVADTTYNQRVLNNNVSYSAGGYADWHPGHAFRVQPRIGYTFYDFSQTSLTIPASNQGSYYADLIVTHNVSDAVNYSVSAGHELLLGVYGDTTKDWYVRSRVNLNVIKDVTLSGNVSYSSGTQALANLAGNLQENYNWVTFGLNLNYNLMKRLNLGAHYRFTVRTSNDAAREYTQNVVGVQLTYALE